MPKCTTTQIEAELVKLAGSDFVCAVAYLRAELKRRKGSAKNAGRKAVNDTPKHAAWRKASRKYRSNKIREEMRRIDEEADKNFDFGS